MRSIVLCVSALLAGSFPQPATAQPQALPGENARAEPEAPASAPALPLAGEWSFRLDPDALGEQERWYLKDLPEAIRLPGTTDEGRKGTENERPSTFEVLSRLFEYFGAAWYQREVEIPEAWREKRVTLFLERCHWSTRVWVDGVDRGAQDSLSTPHVHVLGTVLGNGAVEPPGLAPGKHRITIRVDNSFLYDVGGWSHAASEQTQTRWNGIIGRIELQATDPVWIEDLQVYPDVEKNVVRVRASVRNSTGGPASGTLEVRAHDAGLGRQVGKASLEVSAAGLLTPVEIELPLSPGAQRWDEFSPAIHEVEASLSTRSGGRAFRHSATRTFGLRSLGIAGGRQFSLNGRTLFLRGTLECCIFPRTGYPPCDVESWLRIIRICQEYGLNHIRFHSWCPPEAAFVAADRLGFLFQVEAPCWVGNWGKDSRRDAYVDAEVRRILDAYGNHPSFALMSMGNEPGGDLSVIHGLVRMAKAHDPRHLYTAGTGWGAGPDDDYIVTFQGRGVRGPATEHDLRAEFAASTRPTISHEIGQWAVYPNLDELPKYDGVLRARNFELIREDLRAKGILDQAAAFTRASGLFSAQLYKEEMELLFRTPGHAGFQLLDLHDFPGQGTSIVGILDAFWDSKGLIEPREWRRFCAPTVPLLRVKKRVWTADETFVAAAEVAHFGAADIDAATPRWMIRDDGGREVASGSLPARALPTGRLTPLGEFSAALAGAEAPRRLTVTVAIDGTEAANDWRIWVYPARVDLGPPPGVTVRDSWGEETLKDLEEGKRVVLLPRPAAFAKTRPGSFLPVFWNPVMFRSGPLTMSILCDPAHPALALFPTEVCTDWQWHEILRASRSAILDELPGDIRPIVAMIDNFSRNHRLGLLFESRVGRGRILVSSMDLSSDLERRPAARQLLRSILQYAGSERFLPARELSAEQLGSLFRKDGLPILSTIGAEVISVDTEDKAHGNTAGKAIDGEAETFWHTPWGDTNPPFPHEIVVDMKRELRLAGIRYLPRQDMQNGWFTEYEVYVSADGKEWGRPAAKGSFEAESDEQVVRFAEPRGGRFLRLVALRGLADRPWAAIAELDVIAAEARR